MFSLDQHLLNWVMEKPRIKSSLFQFVDVLASLDRSSDVLDHLRAYFDDTANPSKLPRWIRWGLRASTMRFVPDKVVAEAARFSVRQLADRFIAGSDAGELGEEIERLESEGFSISIDRLGEEVAGEQEAEEYRWAYQHILQSFDDLPESEVARTHQRSLSVKLTALDSQFDSLARQTTLQRLERRVKPILRQARKRNIIVYFDMEQDSTREITLELIRRLLGDDEFADWDQLGMVIQAYHRHSTRDCKKILKWCENRNKRLWVRLVKGAYWDYERIIAYRNNWDVPVYESKTRTDRNYCELARLLGDYYPTAKPAFGSHNLYSLSYGIEVARQEDMKPGEWELQMLYGMGEPIQQLLNERGYPVRLYVPYGELLPGMSYLVRRLLENTSNQSFLRQTFHDESEADSQYDSEVSDDPVAPPKREGYRSVGLQNFSKRSEIEEQRLAVDSIQKKYGNNYSLFIDGEWIDTDSTITSVNPSDSDDVVGRISRADPGHVGRALRAADEVFGDWRDTGHDERADWLERLGDRLEQDRRELASWVLLENGKNWREADADVMEAIDFCYYYADQMRRLAEGKQWSWPGEDNIYTYEPRGPTAVIPPWNFPLAILTGMTTAALVTGNPVILKPSSQTPIIAYQFVKRAVDAGLPEGVLQLVPGSGSQVGNEIVEHPSINVIAFTGSREVGLSIREKAGKIRENEDIMKNVVLEMGGKNALVVDADANKDKALDGVIRSAFGYQGQKCSACSRLLLHESIAETFLERLTEAASSLRIGPAADPANFMGPLIDRESLMRIQEYQDLAREEGEVVLEPDVPDDLPDGYYTGPMIVDRVDPDARIAREEIFGPILPVIRYSDLEEAIDIANDVKYALTGGLYSRHPDHIRQVKSDFKVGNLYVNRKITGAMVGRQPFGGFKLSGTGTKAGGPDYLKNFLWPRSVTENTVRRGFSPDEHL